MRKIYFSFLVFVLLFSAYSYSKSFEIYNVSNPSQTYFIVNGQTGYVGIGTNTPGYPLDVVGNARISSNLIVSNLRNVNSIEFSNGLQLTYSSNSIVAGGDLYVSGNLQLSGSPAEIKDVNGNTNIILTGSNMVVIPSGVNLQVSGNVASNLVPSSDNTYELGSSSKQWKNAYIAGDVYVQGLPIFKYNMKRHVIDLSSYPSDRFYPVVFSGYGSERLSYSFFISETTQSAPATYNEHTIWGMARGGGWSDKKWFYVVYQTYYDTNERSILGIYRGTKNWVDIAIYLRGGRVYYVYSDAPSVEVYTSPVTFGSGTSNSTLAIKDENGNDVVGTSYNIAQMWNGITTSKGLHVSDPSYLSTIYQNGNQVLDTSTTFNGDVSGTYNNLQLKAGVVGTNELADNAVTMAKISQVSCPSGQALQSIGGGNYVCVDVNPSNGITGSGSAGQVAFFTGTNTISGDNGFYWDNTNKRLGIGTTSPTTKVTVENSYSIGSYSTWFTLRASGTGKYLGLGYDSNNDYGFIRSWESGVGDMKLLIEGSPVQIKGNLQPSSTNTYSLGSSSLQWKNIYGVNIYQNGNQVIDTITAGNGISVSGTGNSRTISVVFGSASGTAAEGNKQITISTGSGLIGGGTITIGSGGTVTISHADTSSQSSVDNSGGTVIQDITLDTYGHVTGINSVNLDNRYYTETEADTRFANVDQAETITGSWTFNEDVKFMKNIYVAGNISYVNSNTLNVNGSIIPPIDDWFDLGSSSNRWKTLYVGTGGAHFYGTVNLHNANLQGVNSVTINDVGANEGFAFPSNNHWIIDVSPRDRSNNDGNLNLYGTGGSIVVWRPLEPSSDNTLDLGSSSYRFKDAYFAGTVHAASFDGSISASNVEDVWVNENGDTMTGALTINAGAGELRLKPGSADHAYIEFYADSDNPNTRSGWIGYGSSGTNILRIKNELGSVISLDNSVTVSGDLTVNGGNIDMVKGQTSQIHSLGQISFDWTTGGSYDNPQYHGIQSKDENGNWADDLRINSYSNIILTIDSNSNDANSKLVIQKESATNGPDLFTIDETGKTYIAGSVGIGTTNPGEKLDVNGNIKLSGADPYVDLGGVKVRKIGSNIIISDV